MTPIFDTEVVPGEGYWPARECSWLGELSPLRLIASDEVEYYE